MGSLKSCLAIFFESDCGRGSSFMRQPNKLYCWGGFSTGTVRVTLVGVGMQRGLSIFNARC